MVAEAKLYLVGCGHLGSAMLRRWLSADVALHIHVIKPSPLSGEFLQAKGVSWAATPDKAAGFEPDVIILAVRPPLLDAVLPAYARFQNSLFLSVIAGKSLSQLTTLVNHDKGGGAPALIRAMPNVASAIGAGMTFAIANDRVNARQHQLAETLLRPMGDVAWMEDESGFDAATAVSACGPAYIFALTEAMAAAGEKLGLPPALTSRLARQTVIGSGALLAQSPETAAVLRDEIGSPGTMTEAALKILQVKGGLHDLMLEAITAATRHAKKLAQ